MTDPRSRPHPLDDGVSVLPTSEDNESEAQTFRLLLKLSVVLLIVGSVVAFLAAVAAGNARPNSALEKTGTVVNRLGVVAMLISFCGILVAYRIPRLKKFAMRTGPLHWFESGFVNLIVFNVFAAGVLWGLLCFLAPIVGTGGTIAVASSVVVIYASLLATMVVWHRGYLRAYAIVL